MSAVIQYKIQFADKKINNTYRKTMYSPNSALNQFITDYRSPSVVSTYLISPINDVLNGTNGSDTIISESMISVSISSTICKFYQDPDYLPTASPDFSLPTQDLLEIVQAWLNYLQN